jgi:hypothetical protein
MEEEYRIFLFNPDVSGVKGMEKMYFTTTIYNDQYNDPLSHGGDADNNVKEWFRFCKGNVRLRDIDSILYSTDPNIFLSVVNNESYYKNYLANNSFIQYLLLDKNREALDYMIYAKNMNFSIL